MKKILSWVLICILIIILAVNLVIVLESKINKNEVPGLFGYKPLIVLSGSMKSEINVGDLVIVKKVDINKLNKNDIIAFKTNNNTVVTHRILEINKDDNKTCFITKGDSNNIKDKDEVCEKSVVGKYVLKISKLGSVILFIQKPLGFTLILTVVLFIGTIMYLLEKNKINKQLLEELKNSKK